MNYNIMSCIYSLWGDFKATSLSAGNKARTKKSGKKGLYIIFILDVKKWNSKTISLISYLKEKYVKDFLKDWK